jgi:asparagine synthetase B (glutamine-hydrolysing)
MPGTSCSAGNFGLAELGICALSKTYLEQLAIGELISRTSFRAPALNSITTPGVLPTQAGGARDGEVCIYPYRDWEIPTAEQMRGNTRSDAEVVDELRAALRDAVGQRLVADVEVASYLSGGIDSCAVLGLAQQEMDRPIRAFTVTFENPIYDEASIAEAQARHVGSTYHPIPITGREIADAFADAIWHAECSASVFCV